MSIFSKFLGTITHAEEAVRSGLAKAGITEDGEIDPIVTSFFAGDGKGRLRDAAFQYTIDKMKSDGRIIDYIDLGEDKIYLVDEYIDLEVDYSISFKEIARRAHLNVNDWMYLGEVPRAGTRKVKAAIGRLNCTWSETGLQFFLLGNSCSRLRGSGAWVREAFLGFRPDYDKKGPIFFPESASSIWRDGRNDKICFPNLRDSHHKCWYHSMSSCEHTHYASYRICLLCE
jgi:hypothetical protein